MKRIYLCGPISGREDVYEELFYKVQKEIAWKAKKEGVEIEIVSPSTFPCKDLSWEAALKYCIKKLVDCDGIAVLQGWEHSRGCLLELEIAGRLKIPVVHIEPPVDECGLAEFSNHPIYSDVLRYYKKCYFKAEENLDVYDRAGDIALLETVHRYLDPHGFEYIDKENC
ncbi:MAG: DUF4406 domain-containing protein [Treponema sp.]|nr:DUF4406 domain-containing protein [Treponema sp.]